MAPASARDRWAKVLPPALVLAGVLAAWEAAALLFRIPAWLLPAPNDIAHKFFTANRLWLHTRITLVEAFSGFALSAVLGVLAAAAISHSRFLERGLFPYLIVANSVPIIAIAPLLTIWFGYELAPKILIAMIVTFFPIVTNTTRGLQSADYRIIEFMRSVNATRWQVFRKIKLPTALPYLFAAFKISLSLSLIGAVVAEFYGGDHGLGYLITVSATQLQTDLLFVAISILAATGIGCLLLTTAIERWIFRWGEEILT